MLKRLTSTICEDLAVIVADELETGRGFFDSSRVDEVDEFVEEEECKRVNVIEVRDLSVFF